MKCSKCEKKAVFGSPNLCKGHFISYFESKVKDTIKKFELIKKGDKVLVATSGGKDSTTVLYILNKFYKVSALAIDEGIGGYRDKTLEDIKRFCKSEKIPLKIISFKTEFNYSLDEMMKKLNQNSCTVCGAFRRYLLNKYAAKFDKLVTGHNLDDETQAITMNLFRGNISLSAKLGPKTGVREDKKLTTRIKPLYFCSEKEVMTYSLLKKFDVSFNECPYISNSYRAEVRNCLNEFEKENKGTKIKIANSFLKYLPSLRDYFKGESFGYCKRCGEASKKDICSSCTLLVELKK